MAGKEGEVRASLVKHYRLKVADLLIRWAYHIDPQRPAVQVQPGGGWLVKFGGVPLATIDPGLIGDSRPVVKR